MFTAGIRSVAQQRRLLKLLYSCNLIGQYSVLMLILTFDWLKGTIQIFLKLDGLCKAEVNVPAKAIQFILNLESWQKLIKKIDLLAILDFDAAI